MSIRSIGSSSVAPRPAATAPAAPATPAAPTESAKAKTKAHGPPDHAKAYGYRARQDSVSISSDARELAAGSTTRTGGATAPAAGAARAPLTAERVDELRKKVLEGAYNQTDVVDQVAKRLLASGDV